MYFARNVLKIFSAYRLCLAFLIICVIIINTNLVPDLCFTNKDPDPTACHYSTAADILPPAEDLKIKPALDSIFFIDISCRGELLSRQACAVEAAARAHPEKEVHLLFTGPVPSYKGTLDTLRTLDNVKMSRIHLLNYTQGTPAETFIASGILNRTRYKVTHTYEILKYVTLYKWSGIFLDLEALVVNSLSSLGRNWLAREDDYVINSAVMSLSADKAGRSLADIALKNVIKYYRGDCWGHNGPIRITRTMQKYCSNTDVALMSGDTCNGVEVYGPSLIFPIRRQEPERYYLFGTLDRPWVYVYYVWEHEGNVPRNSRYANLAKEYCPNVYEIHGEDFGNPTILTTPQSK